MIEKLDIKNIEVAQSVVDLQRNSYKVEAKLMDFYEIPPLKESIDRLQSCDEIFYGYLIKGTLTGIISFKIIDNVLDIHRLAVDPRNFIMGIASKLINYVEELYKDKDVSKILVSTGKRNIPAINLYLKNGYVNINDVEIAKDVYISKFEKKYK